MKKYTSQYPGLGIIFGAALGGGIWVILGANPLNIWIAGAGIGLGLVAGACLASLTQKADDLLE